jgi:hypothetical protein
MKDARRIGYWSAWSATFFACGYSVAQLFSTAGILPHPKDLFWLFLPSLFLAPAFLLTMVCLDYVVNAEQKIWTAIGITFATVYTVCICIVYFSQLTVVIPSLLQGAIDETHLLAFVRKSFLMAVDCLGYFFMSMSMLFAAFAFRHDESKKWLYRGLSWTGLLLPILILAFFFPFYYYLGGLWMILFPLAMINAARLFRNDKYFITQIKFT